MRGSLAVATKEEARGGAAWTTGVYEGILMVSTRVFLFEAEGGFLASEKEV